MLAPFCPGDGGLAISAGLQFPIGVSPDGQGSLFIADLQNDAIRRVDPGGIITTVAGTLGSGGFAGAHFIMAMPAR